MLRSLVLIAILLNVAFFAWSEGWLKPLTDVAPDVEHDPHRLSLASHADQIVVLDPRSPLAASTAASSASQAAVDAASSASSGSSGPSAASPSSATPTLAPASSAPALLGASEAASSLAATRDVKQPTPANSVALVAASGASTPAPHVTAHADEHAGEHLATASSRPWPGAPSSGEHELGTRCLQAGPFGVDSLSALRSGLAQILAPKSWRELPQAMPEQWWVYMGPYPDADLYARKLVELHHIHNLSFEEVRAPSAYAHGVLLGRYSDQDAAQDGLTKLRLRGIHTARVVAIHAGQDAISVRVPAASADTQRALIAAQWPEHQHFGACPTP